MEQYAASLIEAIQDSNLASVAAHLSLGVDPNTCTRLGLSALHVAAVRNEVQIAEVLVTYKANVNMLTGWGSSVLHLAAHRGADEIIRLLLNNGALPNVTDDNSDTPLHLACTEGHLRVVEMLLKSGADITIKNNAGMTPVDEGRDTEYGEQLISLLNTVFNAAQSGPPAKVAPLQGDHLTRPLLNATEFIPDYDIPTNESFSSLINDFSLTDVAPFVPHKDLMSNNTATESSPDLLNSSSPGTKSSVDMINNYTGTKSLNAAQSFSLLDLQKSGKSISVFDSGKVHDDESFNKSNVSSKMQLDEDMANSLDLSRPSFSLSKMLNFGSSGGGNYGNSNYGNSNYGNSNYGNSIDSSVFRETYQLYQAIGTDNPQTPGMPIYGSQVAVPSIGPAADILTNNSNLSVHLAQPYPSPFHTHSSVGGASVGSEGRREQEQMPNSTTDTISTFLQSTDIVPDPALVHGTNKDEKQKVDEVLSTLVPIFNGSSKLVVKNAIREIAKTIGDPWPTDASYSGIRNTEWICGEDYVLLSDSPLNIGYQEREGSCSLVFKILHQQYGPLVLKMMVNLLNETDHDTGQSGTVFLKKHFSAEHIVPISLSYHPNVVQILHSYNSTTSPFKKYLPLLVPPALDVDVDMASRTSYMVMREYPFSLKNYVNKFVEHKAKVCLFNKGRIVEELQVILLLMLQCLFSLYHLHVNKVVHRDVKLDNFMMRHSGQVILIDFGLAVNLNNSDGSPAVAIDKDDIIAGNPLAWAPEITLHHREFTRPVFYRDVYRSSDLYTLGKMFVSVFEVLGFLEKDSTDVITCPKGLADILLLNQSLVLLRQMCDNSAENRIELLPAILYLGYHLFLSHCTTLSQMLQKIMAVALTPSLAHACTVSDLEHLSVLPELQATVCKYFVGSVPVESLLAHVDDT